MLQYISTITTRSIAQMCHHVLDHINLVCLSTRHISILISVLKHVSLYYISKTSVNKY